jgi:hypothetical protein
VVATLSELRRITRALVDPGFQGKHFNPTRAARVGTPAWAEISERFQRYCAEIYVFFFTQGFKANPGLKLANAFSVMRLAQCTRSKEFDILNVNPLALRRLNFWKLFIP